jgi:hypothetical protein
MAFYLVLAVVGLAIAALLVPLIISSSQTTRSDTSRTHALDAAQAGINVMLGEIRAAEVADVGTTTKLPCGNRAGSVNTVGAAKYDVSVTYYTANPVTSGTQRMKCVAGYGTYDPVSKSFAPKFARIVSTGTDGPATSGSTPGRKLETTYVFKTSNVNIVGGQVRIFPATGSTVSFCWDAGSATPIARVAVTLKACATPSVPQQVFAYRSDLTLQLLSSVSATYPNGLCVDSSTRPAVSGAAIILDTCAALGSPPYYQQWSYNDFGGYTASLPTSAATGALAGVCIVAANQASGQALTAGACTGNTTSPTQAWIPSPAVGAGAAQSPQLVNFQEFGRCIDVTGLNVNADHLIDYPCKQNPFPGAVTWNQRFAAPGIPGGATSATGRISTAPAAVPYCLTSPGTDSGLVVVRTCTGAANQTWTVYGDSSALPYSAKYTIVDSTGRCLGVSDPRAGETWSWIDVEPCTGGSGQKWNAKADLSASVLQDTDEVRP